MGGEKKAIIGKGGWDPKQYHRFGDLRLRPALDLLAMVSLDNPQTVVDMGCGVGDITGYLRERWPQAEIMGVDNSKEMLERAKALSLDVEWNEQDVVDWKPDVPVDLIYSNAALHWLGDHATLFPRLIKCIKPGGVLAVQMPRNFSAPSHQLMYKVSAEGPWAGRLENLHSQSPVETPAFYHQLLSDKVARLDIWETEYLQILEGENPVAEFTKGSWLKPMLDALEEPEKSEFERAYRKKILEAYPPQPDGRTLFPFRRLFLIAVV